MGRVLLGTPPYEPSVPGDLPHPKYLVMGFATNLSEQAVRIFCQSLRSVYGPAECHLSIVTNRHEAYFDHLSLLGVRFESTPNNYSTRTSRVTKLANRILLHSFRFLWRLGLDHWLPEIAQAYPVLIETWHHPQLARWFAYRRILSVSEPYEQVMLSDVKDVVFQAPFFSQLTYERLGLFADANPYGNCYWNDKWYKQAYGRKAFRHVVGLQPICVGTMLGPQRIMLDMLKDFTAMMARSPFGRIEQAIFNHMLHTNSLRTEYETLPNITNAVATLASKAAYDSVNIIGGLICRASDNTVIPVVHMYDRWPETAELCNKKYLVGS